MVEGKSVTESFLSPILHPKLRERSHISMENGSSNRNVARNLKECGFIKSRQEIALKVGGPWTILRDGVGREVGGEVQDGGTHVHPG